jgi:hypothetical protein
MIKVLSVLSWGFAVGLLCQPPPVPDLDGFGRLSGGSPASACPDMAHQVSQNVRFLLFQRGCAREQWVPWLESHTSIALGKLAALIGSRLDDSVIGEADLQQLANALGLPADAAELRFSDLLGESQLNVLVENLRYLLESCPRGGKKQLAAVLRVTPTTVSRWLSEATGISSRQLNKINQYFGLSGHADLRTYPLFLDVEPAAVSQRRKWALAQLEGLPDDAFQSLYPALKRLLEDR